jgi:hypothetical protein
VVYVDDDVALRGESLRLFEREHGLFLCSIGFAGYEYKVVSKEGCV